LDIEIYGAGFEEDSDLRSSFIRELTLDELAFSSQTSGSSANGNGHSIPRTLIQYWHDLGRLPDDVRACMQSWDRLGTEGFTFRLFDDELARAYIAQTYGERESEAFARCRHPAMRSDFLRMCFVLAEGGFYVDADDVLLGEGWRTIYRDGRLKLQPLCYDILSQGMVPGAEIWRADLPTEGRIFYVNNDPLAAPQDHPVIRRALVTATSRLLGGDAPPEIQATTGPGNLTSALAAHARELKIAGASVDFELLRDWDSIAETRWHLSYRNDERNWRYMHPGTNL